MLNFWLHQESSSSKAMEAAARDSIFGSCAVMDSRTVAKESAQEAITRSAILA
jgi:hypothetical protein